MKKIDRTLIEELEIEKYGYTLEHKNHKHSKIIIIAGVLVCIIAVIVGVKGISGTVDIGDTITFGQYEQDNDTSNGKEDIEWLVLDKEDNKVLVISKYALDCKQYNEEWEDVTWEKCDLRKWLNNTFIDEAFSAEEQKMIETTNVSADENPEYSTDPGNDTKDKIFLLSINEAEQYFKSDEDRMCVPTDYAETKGVYTNDDYTVGGKATCWWWLRSPGGGQTLAAYVYIDGSVLCSGLGVVIGDHAVRPALWINLES